MKHTATALLFVLAAAGANAESVRFINGDESEVTDLCIAAATGAADLNTRASRLNIRNFTSDDVLCNGMPLNEFMRKYRTVKTPDTVIMSFRKLDDSPETDLCYAAITFRPGLDDIKTAYLRRHGSFDAVLCNGMAFERFVEKYRQQVLTASVQ
jgi:hypothetical protein